MSKKKIVHPDRNPDFVTGAYSDGLLVDGFLYVSGQAAVNFKTSQFELGTIEEETERTLRNIEAIVKAAGGTMDDIIKCTVHLADINDFNAYNAVYSNFFPGIKPTRTTVQSVLLEGLKVEIDCVAKITK
jgi:2-iminobutanoate/2-iminopropanoate deaminase